MFLFLFSAIYRLSLPQHWWPNINSQQVKKHKSVPDDSALGRCRLIFNFQHRCRQKVAFHFAIEPCVNRWCHVVPQFRSNDTLRCVQVAFVKYNTLDIIIATVNRSCSARICWLCCCCRRREGCEVCPLIDNFRWVQRSPKLCLPFVNCHSNPI